MAEPTLDRNLLAAIAWCRLGGELLGRPHEGAYHRAKAMGLLAQDDVWRATDRGEGALIAAGLMEGEPAPARTLLVVWWARCDRYPTPQFVGAWPASWEDSLPDILEEQLREARDRFLDDSLPGDGCWFFWRTHGCLPTPPAPAEEA